MKTVSLAISPVERQYRKLLRFMKRHKLEHNPIRDLKFLAIRVIKLGGCPCRAKQRPKCPCGQALKEVEKIGHCLCWEFFSPDFDYRNNSWKKQEE